MQFDEIERILGYKFNDRQLLKDAFVHSSYAQEHNISDNERMEFFGDSVLEYISSEYLYDHYPHFDAGQLSKARASVVSATGLKKPIDEMGLMKHLMVSNSYRQVQSKSRKIQANLYEAILCAIYMDGGMEPARKFVLKTLKDQMDSVKQFGKDSKSQLKEYCDKLGWKPEYRELSKQGPDNQPTFKYALYINDEFVSNGVGGSKKKAEADAAEKALEKFSK
ncbi:MAG TPA: ribonuclease III [Candidatus Limihabitans stercoravium]|nr:ribonuclease III [Candidatus Limihabitans stercoravium]